MSQDDRTFHTEDGQKPYTHLDFKNDPDDFQFVIVADDSGGARPGVFSAAMDMVNLMQPEFVLCLGDLIEGYAEDEAATHEMWRHVDEDLAKLEMPFFFLPGNHDINTKASVKVWEDRVGDDRGYYHFVYKNVLFLLVNTEDPAKDPADLERLSPELYKEIEEAYVAVKKLVGAKGLTQEDVAEALQLLHPVEVWSGQINISEEQVEYFKKVIADNPEVRWTFVLMHSPAWGGATAERDPGNFAKIEALLEGRQYTALAAHTHTYDYAERDGRDYITAACTGALQFPRKEAIDHFLWVTMTDEGPKIANILLNGVMDKKGPVRDMGEFGLYHPGAG